MRYKLHNDLVIWAKSMRKYTQLNATLSQMLSSQSWQKQSACRIKTKQHQEQPWQQTTKTTWKEWVWNRQEAKTLGFEHENSKSEIRNDQLQWNWSMIMHNSKRNPKS